MRRTSNATFNNFKWSKADHDLMVALLKEGKNYAQIGKCLGRSTKAIEQHAYQTRKKLKESGMSDKTISELIPNSRRIKRRIVRSPDPVESKSKEEPIVYSGGALFESQIGNLLIASAACAIGIWFMVGILIASVF
jgi:hypothetical protein